MIVLINTKSTKPLLQKTYSPSSLTKIRINMQHNSKISNNIVVK